MIAVAPPPHFLRGTLLDVRVALELIALVFAIRVYRIKPTPPFRFMLWAFLCLVIPQLGLFVFTIIHGYVFPRSSRFLWIYYADPFSLILFFVFVILSLRLFLRERVVSATPRV
jgi:hypothetical protein